MALKDDLQDWERRAKQRNGCSQEPTAGAGVSTADFVKIVGALARGGVHGTVLNRPEKHKAVSPSGG